MTGIEWAAIIGAAAWLPQIGYFVWHLVKKPRLRFSAETTIEIGFTSFGPIANPSFSISSTRKEALIENVNMAISHDDGDTHNFRWQMLDEKGFEGKSSKGETIEMRRSQSASALKIGTIGLIERKIAFQDIHFKIEYSKLLEMLIGREKILFEKDRPHYPENVFLLKEYDDLLSFLKKQFYWKEGKYTIALTVDEASSKKPHKEIFEFVLNKQNIDSLEMNIAMVQLYIDELFLLRAGRIQTLTLINWNWVYTNIDRKQN
ncbi:MAG TPA: hypothetical protein DEO33_05950 [Rikenellaceae bacterium]|nr:hypothetical protein [Rikenellaceae bacterium]